MMISRLKVLLGGAAAVALPFLFRGLRRTGEKMEALAENAGQNSPVTRSLTVSLPVEEVYHFWRDLTNLPLVMDQVESIYVIGNTLTHWTLKPPVGTEFDVETYIDIPNEMIAWRSLPKSAIQSGGSLRLRPVESGTEIELTIEFSPPADKPNFLTPLGERDVDHMLRAYQQSLTEASIEVEAHGGI